MRGPTREQMDAAFMVGSIIAAIAGVMFLAWVVLQ